MGQKIKLMVSTGFANCEHVEYQELPEWWEELTSNEKDEFIQDSAREFYNECCEFSGKLVDEDEEEEY